MMRVLVAVILFFSVVLAKEATCIADDKAHSTTISRAAIDKKYAFIEKHLPPRIRHRLSAVTKQFQESVKSAIVNARHIDIYSMARLPAKKLFSISTEDQLDAVIFHMLITTLKELESDVAAMRKKYGETTTMYEALNTKAFLLFETGTELYRTIEKVPPKTIRKIP